MVIRCLIVDDSAIFLRAARALLESEGIAVAIASSGDEARRHIEQADPDVVLVDIDLGDENGFDVAAQLSGSAVAGGRSPRITLISSHSHEDFEELIVDSPARGFLNKSALSGAAIRSMMEESP